MSQNFKIFKVLDAEHLPQQFVALNSPPSSTWKIKVRRWWGPTRWVGVHVRIGADLKRYIGQHVRFHDSEIFTP